MTETSVTLRLSERARAKLAEKVASSGQDLSAVASDLIEQAVTKPTLTEIMAPVREQIVQTCTSEVEFDQFLRSEVEAHRAEKKASTK